MSIILTAKGSFSKSLFIFYILSMATSLFNFLYYPSMARLLSPSLYGEVQFLVSMLFQVSVIFMALNIITIILSARHGDSNIASKKIAALASLFNIATTALTILGVVALAYGGTSLFKFSSPWPFVALGAAALSTVPFTIAIGRLQGRGFFVDSGLLNAGGSLLKLTLSVIFVISGLGTMGALLGIAAGQLVATVIAILVGKIAGHEVLSFNIKSYALLREDRRLIYLAGACIIAVNILSIIDVTYAKISLTPHDAGIYAGTATLAKIALYIVSPLMWMVIPLAVTLEKNRQKIIILTLLSLALCCGLLLFYVLFGRWFVSVALGSSYPIQPNTLVAATVAMGALAIATFMNAILAASSQYMKLVTQTVLMVGVGVGTIILLAQRQSIITILLALTAAGVAGIIYYAIALRFEDIRK